MSIAGPAATRKDNRDGCHQSTRMMGPVLQGTLPTNPSPARQEPRDSGAGPGRLWRAPAPDGGCGASGGGDHPRQLHWEGGMEVAGGLLVCWVFIFNPLKPSQLGRLDSGAPASKK